MYFLAGYANRQRHQNLFCLNQFKYWKVHSLLNKCMIYEKLPAITSTLKHISSTLTLQENRHYVKLNYDQKYFHLQRHTDKTNCKNDPTEWLTSTGCFVGCISINVPFHNISAACRILNQGLWDILLQC